MLGDKILSFDYAIKRLFICSEGGAVWHLHQKQSKKEIRMGARGRYRREVEVYYNSTALLR